MRRYRVLVLFTLAVLALLYYFPINGPLVETFWSSERLFPLQRNQDPPRRDDDSKNNNNINAIKPDQKLNKEPILAANVPAKEYPVQVGQIKGTAALPLIALETAGHVGPSEEHQPIVPPHLADHESSVLAAEASAVNILVSPSSITLHHNTNHDVMLDFWTSNSCRFNTDSIRETHSKYNPTSPCTSDRKDEQSTWIRYHRTSCKESLRQWPTRRSLEEDT